MRCGGGRFPSPGGDERRLGDEVDRQVHDLARRDAYGVQLRKCIGIVGEPQESHLPRGHGQLEQGRTRRAVASERRDAPGCVLRVADALRAHPDRHGHVARSIAWGGAEPDLGEGGGDGEVDAQQTEQLPSQPQLLAGSHELPVELPPRAGAAPMNLHLGRRPGARPQAEGASQGGRAQPALRVDRQEHLDGASLTATRELRVRGVLVRRPQPNVSEEATSGQVGRARIDAYGDRRGVTRVERDLAGGAGIDVGGEDAAECTCQADVPRPWAGQGELDGRGGGWELDVREDLAPRSTPSTRRQCVDSDLLLAPGRRDDGMHREDEGGARRQEAWLRGRRVCRGGVRCHVGGRARTTGVEAQARGALQGGGRLGGRCVAEGRHCTFLAKHPAVHPRGHPRLHPSLDHQAGAQRGEKPAKEHEESAAERPAPLHAFTLAARVAGA